MLRETLWALTDAVDALTHESEAGAEGEYLEDLRDLVEHIELVVRETAERRAATCARPLSEFSYSELGFGMMERWR